MCALGIERQDKTPARPWVHSSFYLVPLRHPWSYMGACTFHDLCFCSCGDRGCITCLEYKPYIAETEGGMVQVRGWLCHLLSAAVFCLASTQHMAMQFDFSQRHKIRLLKIFIGHQGPLSWALMSSPLFMPLV